jgi:hypothetical protein
MATRCGIFGGQAARFNPADTQAAVWSRSEQVLDSQWPCARRRHLRSPLARRTSLCIEGELQEVWGRGCA